MSELLFLCDGDDGLKVFNKEDHTDLRQEQHYRDINAFDVLPCGYKLLMIGADGFYQYDYSDMENIYLLSTIPVG